MIAESQLNYGDCEHMTRVKKLGKINRNSIFSVLHKEVTHFERCM